MLVTRERPRQYTRGAVTRARPGGPGRGSRVAGRWFRPGSRVAGRGTATPSDPANPGSGGCAARVEIRDPGGSGSEILSGFGPDSIRIERPGSILFNPDPGRIRIRKPGLRGGRTALCASQEMQPKSPWVRSKFPNSGWSKFRATPVGSGPTHGPRHMICVTIFACCASRETRVERRVRFSHSCGRFDSRNVQQCDKIWSLGPLPTRPDPKATTHVAAAAGGPRTVWWLEDASSWRKDLTPNI